MILPALFLPTLALMLHRVSSYPRSQAKHTLLLAAEPSFAVQPARSSRACGGVGTTVGKPFDR